MNLPYSTENSVAKLHKQSAEVFGRAWDCKCADCIDAKWLELSRLKQKEKNEEFLLTLEA